MLLLTQQPVASDMRFIVSVMNVVVDMERIGDQIRDIAETAAKCTELPGADEIVEMCDCCSVMIKGALDAYIGRDVEGARRVEAKDDKVDAAFDSLKIQTQRTHKNRRGYGQYLELSYDRQIPRTYRRPRDEHSGVDELRCKRDERRKQR